MLENIDIIVDGQFEEENKLVDLKFRGSTNQKKIDVQASIKSDSVVALKFGDEERYTNKKPKVIKIQEYKEKQDDIYSDIPKFASYEINYDNDAEINPITIQKPLETIAAKSEEGIPEESLT